MCPHFSSSEGLGYSFGGVFELEFYESEIWDWGLIARIGYFDYSYNETMIGEEYPSLVDDGQGGYKTIYTTTGYETTVDYKTIKIELLYKINLFDTDLTFTFGPSLGVAAENNFKISYNLLEPEDTQFTPDHEDKCVRFENNNRRIVLYDDEIPDSYPVRLALNAGLQYEIEIGIIEIVPFINLSYGILPLNGDEFMNEECPACYNEDLNWKLNTIGGGLALQFKL